MEHNNTDGAGTYFTLASIIFGFISASTLSELAAIVAIGAGLTGIIFNLAKLYYFLKAKWKK